MKNRIERLLAYTTFTAPSYQLLCRETEEEYVKEIDCKAESRVTMSMPIVEVPVPKK